MIDALPLLLSDEGYQISRSVRLRSSASAYFNRTFTTPTNNRIFTWSGWVKRGLLGANISYPNFFGTGSDELLIYSATYIDQFAVNMAAGAACNIITTQVFRDPSAWYHIIVAVDTTQATASNRVKIYVNGVQITAFAAATYPSLNYNPSFNSATAHALGNNAGAGRPFDGYLTEINFIDGLTPNTTTRTVGGVTQTVLTELGEFDAVTGVWKPVRWTRSFGTNGFYLNFSDNSGVTATTIGKDYSGNGNNWTPNNISVTAGATYDSMLDVPTQWADGGNGRGNYAVLNPVDRSTSTNAPVPTNGNLAYATASVVTSWAGVKGTISFSTGKYYFEDDISSLGVNSIGFAGWTDSDTIAGDMSIYFSKMGGLLIRNDSAGIGEAKMVFGTTTSFASGADATNGLFQLAIDFDAGKFWIGKNNTWFGSGDPAAGTSPAGTFTANREMTPLLIAHYATTNGNITHAFNAGQRPFSYTPPSGFKALNTLNLPTPTILKGNQYFDVALQTGNTTGRTVSGLAFQPDLVWVKNRAGSTNRRWGVIDSVRGVNKTLSTALTDAEVTSQTDLLTAFNSDGFTIGADAGLYGWNGFAESYAHFTWKEGATQGFDIVTFTAPATNQSFTVNHSLGVTPSMIIVKRRDSATGGDWWTWHIGLGNNTTDYVALNQTAAEVTAANMWGTLGRSSTAFGVNVPTSCVANGTYVAYLFSEVAGFSRFGSYTGNGSADGPMVFTGFLPRWILLKLSSGVDSWLVVDSARQTYNVIGPYLIPNSSAAEATASFIDFTANGFKIRGNGTSYNASGGTIIYAAFASNPFKYSLAF